MDYDQNQIAFCILLQTAWMKRRPGESGPARFKRAMSAKGGTKRSLKYSSEELTAIRFKGEATRKARIIHP